jgi:glucokinase
MTIVGALDIGGAHVTAGRVDLTAREVEPASRVRMALPVDSELLDAISRAAASLAGPDITRLGVAVPGPFDYVAGVSRIAHKLHGLYGVDLRAQLSRGYAAVHFVNDADAFLLGEWWAGAARGHARAAGITLGTGLGSAFVEDGRILDMGPEAYELSFRGAPVERTISSGGLVASYGTQIEVEGIADRAVAGEPRARRVFEELGRSLGEFLLPFLRAFEPSCLVVGGSIARSWTLFEAGVRSGLEPIRSLRTVTAAEQLDDAPLLGAACYAAAERP